MQLTGENPGAVAEWSSFGKAFYGKEANYFVFPESFVIAYNLLFETCVSSLHAAPILASIFASQYLVLYTDCVNVIGDITLSYYLTMVGTFCVIFPASAFFFLFLDWASKWLIIGRRKPGSYSWYFSMYKEQSLNKNANMYKLDGNTRILGSSRIIASAGKFISVLAPFVGAAQR